MSHPTFRIGSSVLFALALLACHRESRAGELPAVVAAATPAALPGPGAPGRGETAASQYTVAVQAVLVKNGATGRAVLTIKPDKGLHFNEEFPAKFTVAAVQVARCTKDKLTLKDGDVKVVGGSGVVTVPIVGTATGSASLVVKGNFSVCSDEQCYILRDQNLSIPVTVD